MDAFLHILLSMHSDHADLHLLLLERYTRLHFESALQLPAHPRCMGMSLATHDTIEYALSGQMTMHV